MTTSERKERYPVGCRVVATTHYRATLGVYSTVRGMPTGVVVGYGRKPNLIRVLRDGLRRPDTYSVTFWDRIV